MLFKINNINNKFIKDERFEDKTLILLKKMGSLIPVSEKDFHELKKQNYLYEKYNIEEKILDVGEDCKNIIDFCDGVHNLYITSLNPKYTFAMEIMEGVMGYSIKNNSYLILNLAEKDINFNKITSIFTHEYHHVVRNQYLFNEVKKKKVLFDYIIEEGMAENFVLEVLGEDQLNPWAKKRSHLEILEYKSYLLRNHNEEETNIIYEAMYGDLFKDIPLWLGYSYGYYFVRFIIENTHYSIKDLTTKDRFFFLEYVDKFWEKIEYSLKI